MELGKLGIWTTYRRIGESHAEEAAALAEELGYTAFWLGGSPRLPSVRPLLAASDRLVIATSIVNIWAYDPVALAAEYAVLERDFPGRLLVGIGTGHPEATSDYTRPLTAMRAFLDGLDGAETPLPPERRCIAALAPKMLELSAERSLGTIPYFVPVEHTSACRAQLGPGPLVAPEIAMVVESDARQARAVAREFASVYLGLANYTSNLLRFGFGEDDIAGGGSDRLIDAIVPHGTPAELGGVVQEHFAAGADHVVLQAVGEPGIPRRSWTALAEIASA
jgi:probable F420-dependent oxidoreductase